MLAYKFGISPFSFNDVDFLEFITQYERLALQKKDEDPNTQQMMEMFNTNG
jgi:hypothetical protein